MKDDKILWVKNTMPKSEDKGLAIMAPEESAKAMAFHRSFPQYKVTPLAELSGMAENLGVSRIFVKDESYRFGLNAFKVLGGSYAMARYIAEKTGKDISDVDYAYLTSDSLKREFGQTTFYTATDGNHGRGIAWAANRLGQKADIIMPVGSSEIRLRRIQTEGATACISDMNYDDCVRAAYAKSLKDDKGVMIQDTAWEGYEDIPAWIMQGYGTMAAEADRQLAEAGAGRPTHIFVQAGVGSMAGAVSGYFANKYGAACPLIVVVEANSAACLYKSACAGDGSIHNVSGDLRTIMAGLACGEANTISWNILRDKVSAFVSAPEWAAAKGMRMLGCPIKGDPQVVSGESGAVPFGVFCATMQNPEYADLKSAIGLDENSVVLCFSTEGDTDPENYRRIVWDGAYGSEM